ncbi:MAG: hypothetical protein C5B56_15225 [Proteobacteria bacterium]|nr:MAG: hypothetical protein C5B56_15225 [Pseudomonadota bacterium]
MEGTMAAVYDAAFYNEQSPGSSTSAGIVVPLALALSPFRSVVDVGCGVGTWAAEFQKHGLDILGIDGAYVDKSLLKISPDYFLERDLREPISLARQFDLAVSLEVAEHLPESRAESFVADLTNLAPCVLFSAAIPGQSGTGHINEQFLSYWVKLFGPHGYRPVDAIRPTIWNDSRVEWWYRQNIVLFVRHGHPTIKEPTGAPDYIHPELFSRFRVPVAAPPAMGTSALLRALPGAILKSAKAKIGL